MRGPAAGTTIMTWLAKARRARTPRPALRAPAEPVEPPHASHRWYPDDGDEVVHGGHGIDVLNLPSLTAAGLIGALRLAGRGEEPRPGLSILIGTDGAIIFPDEAGREEAVSGTIDVEGRRLRFFGIRRIEFRAEA